MPTQAANSPHASAAASAFHALGMDPCAQDTLHVVGDLAAAHYLVQRRRLQMPEAPGRVVAHVTAPLLYRYEIGRSEPRDYAACATCFMEQRVVTFADEVIAQSPAVANWLRRRWKVDEARLRLAPGPVKPVGPARRSPARQSGLERIIFAGSLVETKGLTTFFHALERLEMQGLSIGEIVVSGRQDPDFPAADYLEAKGRRLRTPIRQLPATNQSRFLQLVRKRGSLTVVSPRFPERPATLAELVGIDAAVIAADYPDTRLDLSPEDVATILFEANHRALAAKIEERVRDGLTTAYTSQRAADFEENARRWADLTKCDSETHRFGSFAAADASSPIVSVCFAHYNRPDKIVASVHSLLSQRYPNKEVIVIDDGSSEENFQRLKDNLEDLPVRIERQENRYLGAARNAGARLAKGQWILFKDDDNLSKENEIEIFASIATRNDSDVLTCFSDNFRGDGLPTSQNLTGQTRLPIGPDPVYGLIRNGFGDSNCFVRRDVWSKLGGFCEDYRIGLDDHEFFARAVANGFTVEVVPLSLYYYRLGGEKMKRFHSSALANERRLLRPAIASGLLPIELLPIAMLARRQRPEK